LAGWLTVFGGTAGAARPRHRPRIIAPRWPGGMHAFCAGPVFRQPCALAP